MNSAFNQENNNNSNKHHEMVLFVSKFIIEILGNYRVKIFSLKRMKNFVKNQFQLNLKIFILFQI